MLFIFIIILFVDLSFAQCPDGAISVPPQYGGQWSCLLFDHTEIGFLTAEDQCVSRGGHLISVPNGFFNVFVTRKLFKK